MSLKKKVKFLFLFFAIFFGSFFVVFEARANKIESPVILDAYQIISENKIKIFVDGYTISLTELSSLYYNIYINGKFNGLANIKKINNEYYSFSYESPWLEKKDDFEVMVIGRDGKTGSFSSPTILKVNSIRKINDLKIAQTIAKNEDDTQILNRIPAPTLINPNINGPIGKVKPLILGLTKSGTFVHVFIDGVYNGKTKILNHDSGTANFAYIPFLNLNIGKHRVWAMAEDKYGQKSQKSDILEFVIEYPMPAPTLLTPQKDIDSKKLLFVSGLSVNNSLIKVFIDHELENQFLVKNNDSGTANFAYDSKKSIGIGSHLIYATAIDNRGKESAWSNIIYFSKYEPKIATATTEKTLKNEEKTVSASMVVEKMPETDSINKKGVVKKISEEKSLLADLGGEKNDKNSILGLNLAIFIIFLAGIIIWMFLVNKELIKENRDQKNRKNL